MMDDPTNTGNPADAPVTPEDSEKTPVIPPPLYTDPTHRADPATEATPATVDPLPPPEPPVQQVPVIPQQSPQPPGETAMYEAATGTDVPAIGVNKVTAQDAIGVNKVTAQDVPQVLADVRDLLSRIADVTDTVETQVSHGALNPLSTDTEQLIKSLVSGFESYVRGRIYEVAPDATEPASIIEMPA